MDPFPFPFDDFSSDSGPPHTRAELLQQVLGWFPQRYLLSSLKYASLLLIGLIFTTQQHIHLASLLVSTLQQELHTCIPVGPGNANV